MKKETHYLAFLLPPSSFRLHPFATTSPIDRPVGELLSTNATGRVTARGWSRMTLIGHSGSGRR